MSVEERLFALAQQCRQQNGDGFLMTPNQLAARLNGQAPDLHAEIRALAAAFAVNVAARISAAPDPAAEANAAASEIALREKLSMTSVAPAVAVAQRLGPLTTGRMGTPTPGGWAGDSMAVGAGQPQPQPTPAYAPQPAYQQPAYQQPAPGYAPQPQAQQTQSDRLKALTKNPLAIGAFVVVLGFLFYQNFMQNRAPDQQQQQPPFNGGQPPQGPNGPNGPNGPGPQQPMNAGQAPALQGPDTGGPILQLSQNPQTGAPTFNFTLSTQRGASLGVVMLPAGGWQSGAAAFGLAAPGDTTGQNMAAGGQGQFQLVQSNGRPFRVAPIQMSQDNLGIGNVCLMFRGTQGQQDVQLSGADFCVMDARCGQPLGCGKLQ